MGSPLAGKSLLLSRGLLNSNQGMGLVLGSFYKSNTEKRNEAKRDKASRKIGKFIGDYIRVKMNISDIKKALSN
ncbi:hypothetical protein [Vibrio breoganii]|uniref:hypothetical protein n=1 Tax=Vibrio breoganii TaxID=553239 RepID=UPI001A7E110C|nr:hypothetical protein [Vibrio breoganii]